MDQQAVATFRLPGRLAKESVKVISIVQLAVNGFWYCARCERATALGEDKRGGNCCERCGSGRIEFREPIFPPVATASAESETVENKTL